MAIKFIFFDVGGVVLRDFSASNKWADLQQSWGISPDQAEKFKSLWQKYELELCSSRDINSLVPILNQELNLNLPASFSILTEFVTRFETNEFVLPALKVASSKAKIGLLTNMYFGMLAEINQRNLLPKFNWDLIIDSSRVGYAKPQSQIYTLTEQLAGATKSEILFIDNSPANLETAHQFGWQTYLFDPKNYAVSSQKLADFIQKI